MIRMRWWMSMVGVHVGVVVVRMFVRWVAVIRTRVREVPCCRGALIFVVGVGKIPCCQRFDGWTIIVSARRTYTFYVLLVVVGKASSRTPRVPRSVNVERGAYRGVIFLWRVRQLSFMLFSFLRHSTVLALDGLGHW